MVYSIYIGNPKTWPNGRYVTFDNVYAARKYAMKLAKGKGKQGVEVYSGSRAYADRIENFTQKAYMVYYYKGKYWWNYLGSYTEINKDGRLTKNEQDYGYFPAGY